MCVGVAISYVDRVNISHALVPLSSDLHLQPFQQGVLLSAFSLGYVCMMPVSGILTASCGAARTISFSGTAWSAATALLGFSPSFSAVAISRAAIGVSEAPLFPANAQVVAEVFPPMERARATALFDAGSYLGIAVAAPLVVLIIRVASWRWSFVACGGLSLLWVVVWGRFSSNVIVKGNTASTTASWRVFCSLLSRPRFLGLGLGFFCYNYVKSFFLTWLPAYLVRERGLSFGLVGIVGMLPALSAIMGEALGGWSSDTLLRRGCLLRTARRIPICSGLVLGGASIVAVAATHSNVLAIVALCSAFAFTIMSSAGIWSIPADIAPTCWAVGTIGALQNTMANFGGIVSPIVVGATVQRTGNFGIALLLTALVAVIGSVLYWVALADLGHLGETVCT